MLIIWWIMKNFTPQDRLELGAYIVCLALTIPSYVIATSLADGPIRLAHHRPANGEIPGRGREAGIWAVNRGV